MKKLGAFLLLLLAIAGAAAGILLAQGRLAEVIGVGSRGNGSIEVISAGSPEAGIMDDVQQAVKRFPEVMETEMGVKLNRSIKVYVAASGPVYQQVLEKEFKPKPDEAKNIAEISGGWSGGRRAVTAINGKAGVMSGSSDRWSTTAHELFHQVQYELSDGNDTDEKALFWLEEGSADYVGAVVAEQMGGKTREKWLLDTKADLMSAPKAVSPQKLQHNTLEQREALMKKDLHAYQMADLMTWYLLDHYAKNQEGLKLAEYFRQLGKEHQGEAAFRNAFGVSLAEFLAEFDAWWQAEQQHPAVLHFVARPGVQQALAKSLSHQAELTQQLFQSRFGRKLHGEYQVILAADQQDLMASVMAYCGLSEKRAKELAGSSLWIENGSTILVNASQLDEERQQIFSVGVMLMRILEAQRMGQPERNVEWLTRGSGYIMGVARLGESGLGSLGAYQRSWLATLQQADLPDLEQMLTADGFRQVADRYTDDTASVLAEYAVAELVNRYGWKSLLDWQESARHSGDSRKAFQDVFGMPHDVFAAQVQAKIRRGQ